LKCVTTNRGANRRSAPASSWSTRIGKADRDAGADANDLHVRDRADLLEQLHQARSGQQQRIAARDEDVRTSGWTRRYWIASSNSEREMPPSSPEVMRRRVQCRQ